MTARGRFLLSIFFVLTLLAVGAGGAAPAVAQTTPPGGEQRILIKELAVQGNRRVQEAVILGRVQSKVGTAFIPPRAADDIRSIFALGFFDDVQLKVEDFEGGVKLTFVVTERPFVRDLSFAGNKRLDAAVLQEKIDLKLGGVYNDNGYIQARVESTETQVDRQNARVTIRIVVVEGPQFRVGGVDITGNNILPIEEIRRRVQLKPNDIYSRAKLRDSAKDIGDVYGTIGRAAADVNPQIALDVPNRKINITLEITEGPEVFVERINISGNTRSQEKILRREIPMAEGDLFTTQKLERAKQKLKNLNYFEKVETKTVPGSTKDKIIVNIEVTEKPTGIFSVGGGYSSQDGALGTVDLSQNNFLGRGLQVAIRLRGGAALQEGTIGITDPWFLDRPLAAGFDIFSNRRVNQDYTQASTGGDVRF